MTRRLTEEELRMSPKDDVYGRVESIDRYDGDGAYGSYTFIKVVIARSIQGEWDKEAKSFSIKEQLILASLKPKNEEEAERWLRILQPRDTRHNFPGTLVHVTGWVGANIYKDKKEQDPSKQWKIGKPNTQVQRPSLDEAFIAANNDVVAAPAEEDYSDALAGLDDLGMF